MIVTKLSIVFQRKYFIEVKLSYPVNYKQIIKSFVLTQCFYVESFTLCKYLKTHLFKNRLAIINFSLTSQLNNIFRKIRKMTVNKQLVNKILTAIHAEG